MLRVGVVELGAAVGALAERCEVVDGRGRSGDRLVALRPGLEAVSRRVLVCRSHAIGGPASQQLAAPPGAAEMRAEELVRRAQQHVDARARRRRSGGAGRSARRRPTRARRRDGRSRRSRRASGIVPTAFDASVNATILVRSLTRRLERVEVEVEVGLDDVELTHDESRDPARRAATARRSRRGRAMSSRSRRRARACARPRAQAGS